MLNPYAFQTLLKKLTVNKTELKSVFFENKTVYIASLKKDLSI